MVNPCPFPVEVYCLDLDKQYMMEEDMLRSIDSGRYNEAGLMYQVPLDPGQQIWADLVEEALKNKQAAAAAAAAADSTAAEAAPAAADDGEVGDLDVVAAADISSDSPASKLVIVLHGPALAGSTTQARLIGERYKLPALTFDDLLFEGADIEAPPPPEAEAVAATIASDAASPLDAAAEATNAPYFDAAISDLLYEKVFIDPDLENQPGFVAPASKLQEVELNELLVRGLKQAFNVGSRFASGLVLDGLRSKYCPPGAAAKILMQALGMQAVVSQAAAAAAAAPPKASKKGGPPEPAAPPPAAEGWNGPHDVFFLTFDATAELVRERVREKKKQEAVDKPEALDLHATAEGASPGPPEAELIGEELTEEEVAAKAAEASRLAAEAAEAELAVEADALLQSFAAESAAVAEQLGKPDFQGNRAVRRSFDPSGASPERVMLAACGIRFNLGRVSVALPQLESDAMLIPDPYMMQVSIRLNRGGDKEGIFCSSEGEIFSDTCTKGWLVSDAPRKQVVQRPRNRPVRKPILKFKLLTEREPSPEERAAAAAAEEAAVAAAAAAAKGAKGKGKADPPPSIPQPASIGLYEQGRWVIPANGSVDLAVHFQSEEELGKFTNTLAFEVVGGERNNLVTMTGTCGLPTIATDYRWGHRRVSHPHDWRLPHLPPGNRQFNGPSEARLSPSPLRNVFYKKVKTRPQTPSIARQYIISKNMFEFGPLLMNKDPTGETRVGLWPRLPPSRPQSN